MKKCSKKFLHRERPKNGLKMGSRCPKFCPGGEVLKVAAGRIKKIFIHYWYLLMAMIMEISV